MAFETPALLKPLKPLVAVSGSDKQAMSSSLIPLVGTEIQFKPEQASLSKDERTHVVRVTYDEAGKRWVIASTYNLATDRWVPITKSRRIGLVVWLNDAPSKESTTLVISSIHRSGRAVYADVK
jgi:hypothetical protein